MKKIGLTWVMAILTLFIAAVLFFKLGQFGFNNRVLTTYIAGAGVALLFILGTVALDHFAKGKSPINMIARFGGVEEEPLFDLFSNQYFRWGVILFLTAIIGFGATNGNQVWSPPDMYSDALEFGDGASEALAVTQAGKIESVFMLGVVPAITEDAAAMIISIAYLVVFLGFVVLFGGSIKPLWVITGLMVFALPLAALTFMNAHEIVGGQDTTFLLSAFIFQYLNLLVFWVTGLFVPLAHFVHNSVFALGFAIAVGTVASTQIIIPLCSIGKKKLVGEKTWVKNQHTF